MKTDVLVVGAGPAGLVAALTVAGAGFDTAIAAPAQRGADHRTAALMAGSVAILDGIGVWRRVAASAAPLKSLRIVDGTNRLIRAPEVTFHASEIGLGAFGHNIANVELVTGLEGLAAERGIRRIEASVSAVHSDDGTATAELEDGTRIAARLVVAADGRRSRVRESVGIAVREWRYDQAALVASLRHTLPHHDTSTEFHTDGGPFTLVPLPGNRSSLVWVDRPTETERRKALAPDRLALEIEARSASILGKIAIDGPVQAFPLSAMGAARFAAQRVVLVGEAAHLFPPIGAQGLNLGLRDVAALGRVLAGAADPGAADRLRAYGTARRGDVYTRTAAVDALNRTLLTGFLPVQAMRGLGLFLLDRVPVLRRALMREGIAAASEGLVHYRG